MGVYTLNQNNELQRFTLFIIFENSLVTCLLSLKYTLGPHEVQSKNTVYERGQVARDKGQECDKGKGTRAGALEKVTNMVPDKVTGKVTVRVTDRQLKIIEEIRKNQFITTSELEQIVGILQRKIKENIRKLREKRIIKRNGPSKGGHWEVIGKP